MSAGPGLTGPIGAGRWDSALNSHFSDGFGAGDLVFVSGQLPVDDQLRLVGGDDVGAQARQVFSNIARVLADAGRTLEDVVTMTLYFIDVADVSRIADVRREMFGDHRPASTAVQIAGLLVPGAKLEVNAVAYRPANGAAALRAAGRPDTHGGAR